MADADELHKKRQGFWLRIARESAGLKQEGAAQKIGLKTKSAISDYENGTTEPPPARLRRLAKLYGWPLAMFTEPMETAEEIAQERMAQLARAAIRTAAAVSGEEAEAERRGDVGSPEEQPQRRLA